MKFDPQDRREFIKIIKSLLITSFIVQFVMICVYYFGEKQVTLIVPMLLALLSTGIALFYTFGLKEPE